MKVYLAIRVYDAPYFGGADPALALTVHRTMDQGNKTDQYNRYTNTVLELDVDTLKNQPREVKDRVEWVLPKTVKAQAKEVEENRAWYDAVSDALGLPKLVTGG